MKKNLDYYLNLDYRMELVHDPSNDSYVLYFPDLPGCITSGKSVSDAMENAKEAKRVWFMAALEDCPDRIVEPQTTDVSDRVSA